jgi:hypothetical protein
MPSSRACLGIRLSTSGVRTKPGQITLERTGVVTAIYCGRTTADVRAGLGRGGRMLPIASRLRPERCRDKATEAANLTAFL